MEENLRTMLRFYLLATQLNEKIRSGWDETHWNICKQRIESVAEHVFGTCILALGIYSESDQYCIDIDKVLKMLILHEMGEVIIGDITPFDNITPEEKKEKEHEALKKIFSNLSKNDEFYSLLLQFDDRKTEEANFAYLCDKLQADIQAKVYEDFGYQNSLDNQTNNVVFKSKEIQGMAKEANTAFDIWYQYDRNIYCNHSLFSEILEYVKRNDTREISKITGECHN